MGEPGVCNRSVVGIILLKLFHSLKRKWLQLLLFLFVSFRFLDKRKRARVFFRSSYWCRFGYIPVEISWVWCTTSPWQARKWRRIRTMLDHDRDLPPSTQLNSCLAQASRMVQSRPSRLLRTLPTRFGTLIDVVVWQCSSREREEKGKAGNNSLACFGFIYPILSSGCWLLHTTIGALTTNQESISTLCTLAKAMQATGTFFLFLSVVASIFEFIFSR